MFYVKITSHEITKNLCILLRVCVETEDNPLTLRNYLVSIVSWFHALSTYSLLAYFMLIMQSVFIQPTKESKA
ncbi:Metaxin-1 [Frankliniella fusca]|uniref:Metaxin-1 n=1 Tax=Frankliniella fusca TaxID=407009 RepID=A0AAE1HFL0_9NEOP|nr:Metaxin-1 [Frankliniella fusca]